MKALILDSRMETASLLFQDTENAHLIVDVWAGLRGKEQRGLLKIFSFFNAHENNLRGVTSFTERHQNIKMITNMKSIHFDNELKNCVYLNTLTRSLVSGCGLCPPEWGTAGTAFRNVGGGSNGQIY
jgi:hypothetical protein